MVREREIESNPKDLKAIVEMKSPSFHKDVQILNGRLATLN